MSHERQNSQIRACGTITKHNTYCLTSGGRQKNGRNNARRWRCNVIGMSVAAGEPLLLSVFSRGGGASSAVTAAEGQVSCHQSPEPDPSAHRPLHSYHDIGKPGTWARAETSPKRTRSRATGLGGRRRRLESRAPAALTAGRP